MKNRFLLLVICIFFLPFVSHATHIVGGSLTYEQLGGSTYRVTLKLYRDCKPGSVAFPGSVGIIVRRNCGATLVTTINIPFPGSTSVPPNIDTCAVNPGICLEEATYTKVVSGLPPTPGGYDLYFQYCCRNSTLINIVSPLTAGETWYAHIPDNGTVISNSSPKWVKPPPVFVCQGLNMNVDHSATDADGDSLVYSLYTPYSDPAPSWPGCVFTATPVTWSSTYGANNPLDASTPGSLTISPSGILNGIPPMLGQFVAGVRCEEWRSGVKIGEILRDFQFNVVNCPPLAVASFGYSGACSGTTINFNNTTTPAANSYLWDFGDGSPTSTVTSPTHTYPSLGTYVVTLIINNGTPCADTAIQTLNISTLAADFVNDAPNCKGIPINFTDTSTVASGDVITNWDWNFGDGFTSTLQDPSHTYGSGGLFNATLIVTSAGGCKDTIVYPVNIQGLPIANAGADTISCTNNPTVTLGGTVLNAGGGVWTGNGVFTPPGASSTSTLNPTYTPTAAAVTAGADTLILYTTSNGFCPADTDQVIITFYAGPTADAGPDLFVCKDTTSVPVCATVTVASGGVWSTTGSGTFVSPTSLCTSYIPSSADTTAGSVMLYLSTTGNGTCNATNDTTLVTFTSTPVAVITSGGSACQSNPVAINSTSTTGDGIWTTLGSGTFSPSDTTLTGAYLPSPADDAAGTVTLIFTSTNNGGCRSNADTVTVTLIPSPVAVFSSVSACPLDTVTFTDASTTSVGTVTSWNWNFGDTGTSTLQDPTHIYGAGGPYNVQLIVTSSNGCVDTLTQTVNVYETPIANFSANGICLSDGTVYTDMSTVTGATITAWSWNFGDSSPFGTTQNPSHNFPAAGTYNSTLIVTSSQGCIDSVTNAVTVLPGPLAGFGVDDPIGNVGQAINFNDLSTNGPVAWFWDFGDNAADSTSSLQNPSHVYGSGGFYDVCLIVTDVNGCTDTICKTEIISMPPTVPTAFTPNGDGENDMFYIFGGPFKEINFKIYNNWGELIFETTDKTQCGNHTCAGWDGKRDGIDQAIGVYVYTVVGITEDDKEHHLSGDVTLLR